MPGKISSTGADDDLLAQLGDLGVEGSPSSPIHHSSRSGVLVDDPLADLENLAKESPIQSTSTPRRSLETPAAASTRPSVGQDSSRQRPQQSQSSESRHTSSPPPERTTDDGAAAGSSWWGGWVASASTTVAAVARQAEAAVKEIQESEEGKKWAEQVKGNVGVLRGLGDELTSRAIPTFNTIIDTLAPPIPRFETLHIHVGHGMVGYPSVERTVYNTFSRVITQIEEGELAVTRMEAGQSDISTFDDESWWKGNDIPATAIRRDINSVANMGEGTKLARSRAVAYATEYYASLGTSIEEAIQSHSADIEEPEETDGFEGRTSNIFLTVQPLSFTEVRLPPPNTQAEKDVEDQEDLISFAIYLYDPVNAISLYTISQSFPKAWADWLDHFPSVADSDSEDSPSYPPEIARIILAGGIDPREWVADWIADVLSLSVGIVGQRYIAHRLGVGAAVGATTGTIASKKIMKDGAVESGAGEAARAL